jgi:hypothetical protein
MSGQSQNPDYHIGESISKIEIRDIQEAVNLFMLADAGSRNYAGVGDDSVIRKRNHALNYISEHLLKNKTTIEEKEATLKVYAPQSIIHRIFECLKELKDES